MCVFMLFVNILLVLSLASIAHGFLGKCDQTPPDAKNKEPSDEKHPFSINIINAAAAGKNTFTADQTYLLVLASEDPNRSFRWFMITAENPDVDGMASRTAKDGGSLKSLDIGKSRHSERCANSVENFDNADKPRVEIHWVSPHDTPRVRIRAMVAENEEIWYQGNNLTITLVQEQKMARDSPPFPPNPDCNICSEARYEVIFKGKWSRVAHPLHYPTKPDENGYTHMIGASHGIDYFLWKAGSEASEGLKQLLVDANTTVMEREIIAAMEEESGTRTLIRGKRRHHPSMFEPSHSLFRVDRTHHLFSIVVGMRPSPDWFLGMTQFELCVGDQWLEEHNVSLFPWDAGTKSGVSYESEPTDSKDNIERVEVGSFNKASPFYQKNLNDLLPFAQLEVRRLDVYPWDPTYCPESNNEAADEPKAYPVLSEKGLESCRSGEWGEWSPCVPDVGACGIGAQTRTRAPDLFNAEEEGSRASDATCQDESNQEIQHCFVEC